MNITESGHVYGGNPAGRAAGVFCFAVVLAAIGWPLDLDIARVRARLAAGGWPLARPGTGG